MDWNLYRAINGLAGRSELVDGVTRTLASDLELALIGLVALLFLVPWRRHRTDRRVAAVTATVAAGLALVIAQPIAQLIDRVRPYDAHPGDAVLLIPASRDPSFPSDHAAGAFALALAVLFYDRLAGSVLLVLAALLGLSRVVAGTHYPGDVAGGIVLAAVVVVTLRLTPARRRLERFSFFCSHVWDALLERKGAKIRVERARSGAPATYLRPSVA